MDAIKSNSRIIGEGEREDKKRKVRKREEEGEIEREKKSDRQKRNWGRKYQFISLSKLRLL